MIIDRPKVKCLECGRAMSVTWKLYCDECYRRLTAPLPRCKNCGKEVEERKHEYCGRCYVMVNKAKSGVVYDKSGNKYVFNGKSWNYSR